MSWPEIAVSPIRVNLQSICETNAQKPGCLKVTEQFLNRKTPLAAGLAGLGLT
jgi:hypothetical protein